LDSEDNTAPDFKEMTSTSFQASKLKVAHDHKWSETGLVADHIGKSYHKKRVVRSLSLKLKRGEAVGLLGPNGAGKTTCFYMMSGLIKVDEGRISLDGIDITPLPMYRGRNLALAICPKNLVFFTA
jgi:lipopolysaccharide export system ATP-binding protein